MLKKALIKSLSITFVCLYCSNFLFFYIVCDCDYCNKYKSDLINYKMAQHLLSDLVSYFTLDEINIDNWTFKLYYKVSTILCMLGASIGVAQVSRAIVSPIISLKKCNTGLFWKANFMHFPRGR